MLNVPRLERGPPLAEMVKCFCAGVAQLRRQRVGVPTRFAKAPARRTVASGLVTRPNVPFGTGGERGTHKSPK